MSEPRRLIRAFYDEIWNCHDKSAIPVLLDDDFSFRGSLGQVRRGHAGFAEYVDFVHAALGNYHCDVQEIIAEGSKAFARMLFSGIHRGELRVAQPSKQRDSSGQEEGRPDQISSEGCGLPDEDVHARAEDEPDSIHRDLEEP